MATITTEVEVDVYLYEFTDEELIEELIARQERQTLTKSSILKLYKQFNQAGIEPISILDELKLTLIKEAMSKYTLHELEQRLK